MCDQLLSACSSTATPTGRTGGASEAGAGTGGVATGGSTSSGSSGGATGSGASQTVASSACNTVGNAGPEVSKTANAGAFRDTLTGGTFADGTSQLTSWTEYGTSSAGSTTNRETFVMKGSTFEGLVTPNGVGQPELQVSGTFTTSGNTMTLQVTCPQVATLPPSQY